MFQKHKCKKLLSLELQYSENKHFNNYNENSCFIYLEFAKSF